MKTRFSSLFIAAALLALAPVAAHAQCVTHNGGFVSCSLGTAIVQSTPTGFAVENFSLSGKDGVATDVSGNGEGAASILTDISVEESGDDGYWQIRAIGPVDGQPDEVILESTVRSTKNAIYLDVDIPLQSTGEVVAVLDGNQNLIGLVENLPAGTKVRLRDASRSENARALDRRPVVQNWQAEIICPPTDPWQDPWWDWWRWEWLDIIQFNFDGPLAIDVIGPQGAVVDSFVGEGVALTQAGPQVPRGPFLTQSITGAAIERINVDGVATMAPVPPNPPNP